MLKVMYPLLLHVTCATHLLHNCAKHIRLHFKAAKNLIVSTKAAALKIKGAMLYLPLIVYKHLYNQF